MTVSPDQAVGFSEYGGRTYSFCNPDCKARFDADPQRYLMPVPKAVPTPAEKEAMYVCPMDPEVRQQGPGACPKCGMALEPETISAPASKTEWTCPMHPEIVRDAPGSCPICGMALEPRTITTEDENPELQAMSRRLCERKPARDQLDARAESRRHQMNGAHTRLASTSGQRCPSNRL
jgi:Cu+-exporting ATPase